MLSCGAALTSMHIGPYGHVHPCLTATDNSFSLRDKSLEAIWREDMAAERNKCASADFSCAGCRFIAFCPGCPPTFMATYGDPEHADQYCCAIARKRYNALHSDI